MCIYTHACTYTHRGNKSEMIICYNEKRGAIYNLVRKTNKRWYHP